MPGDGKGSVISLGGLGQDLLVDRQIGDCSAKSRILLLQILDPLHLVRLQSAELLAPALVGELRHADPPNSISNSAALRCQNIDLTQLGNDLFGLVSLSHSQSSSGAIPLLRVGPLHRGRLNSFLSLLTYTSPPASFLTSVGLSIGRSTSNQSKR